MHLEPDDRRVVSDVVAVLRSPRREPADSFVLHASLELMARLALLARIPAARRAAARDRLRALGRSYDAWGDPVEPPARVAPDPARLVDALAAGDLDEVDAQVVALERRVSFDTLRAALAEPVLRSLAAAAHGAILLHLLDRVGRGRLPVGLARQALREMARQPTWQLRWFDDPPDPPVPDAPDEPRAAAVLSETLAEVPALGLAGPGIYPIMRQAEESGVAPRLLRGITASPAAAERDLARIAAWSMVQEPDDHVPYGWTHCLTMPQAAVRLADVSALAVPVAATYAVGFRAALGTSTLDPRRPPGEVDPVHDLVARAAAHEDAHLAKCTLASLDAAARDPGAADLHVAAATRLARWWQARDPGATAAPA